MKYSDEQVAILLEEHPRTEETLDGLLVRCLQETAKEQTASPPQLREYLKFGIGRRLTVIKRALQNIFTAFPPATVQLLNHDVRKDAEINLHAFVINVYGFFDSCAWAFAIRHGLEKEIAGRHGIGIFLPQLAARLPSAIKSYCASSEIATWHRDYLKEYRDALVHRIPLYIPPSALTPEDERQYRELESEINASITAGRWERANVLLEQQSAIGSASFVFMLGQSGTEKLSEVVMHQQMIVDVKTLVEFGHLFFDNWHERSQPEAFA